MNQQADGVAGAVVLILALFVFAKLAPPRYVPTAPRVEAAIDLLAVVRRRVMTIVGDDSEVIR